MYERTQTSVLYHRRRLVYVQGTRLCFNDLGSIELCEVQPSDWLCGARGARTEYLSKHGREPDIQAWKAVMQVSNKHRIPGPDLTTYAASGLHLRKLALACRKSGRPPC